MKREYYNRDKAFIGVAIGAVGGIIGGILGNKKKKKQAAAQAEAERINALNQQNAIDTQYRNQQAAIDAQYEQNVLNVRAQEELNRQQNELAAKKTGIENAAGLTALYANQSELNKEFRNRFMKCGGKRKVRKCGGRTKAACGTKVSSKGRTKAGLGTFINSSAGQILGNAIGGVSSGIGSIFANTGPTYTPTSKVLKYRTNTYRTYKPAELEVYDGITDKFNARKVGENTGTYVNAQSNVNNITAMNTLGQNPTAAITATTQLQSPRYVCGGSKKVRKLKRR
jgi:hypothetical protein